MHRYHVNQLIAFAGDLFNAAGVPGERAEVIAKYLVEADMMGHDTHGLNLAAHYLGQLQDGYMRCDGEPTIVNDKGACVTWDADYLPGVWTTVIAIEQAIDRASTFGIGAVCVKRSHHIACLAAFLPIATDRKLAVLLSSSDPSETGVAPHGAVQACFTPNPIAFGYPTEQGPVLIDVSASITTLGMSNRLADNGERYKGQWAIGADGQPTDDPSVLRADPPGALLPLGGIEAGHKGFALALMVEALTSGLAGFGRRDAPTNHGASVFVQVFDPEAFGGYRAFVNETQHLADTCRRARTGPGREPVRLPGDRALAKREDALKQGVMLYPAIMPALTPWAEKYAVPLPAAI